MTAKEYLNRARHLDALINTYLREIDYWKQLSTSISAVSFEPHYNPNTPTDAPFVKILERIDELEAKASKAVTELIKLRDEINDRITLLPNREEQLVLRYRYVDSCSWDEISSMLNVSLRTVHRIHGSALQNFSVPE